MIDDEAKTCPFCGEAASVEAVDDGFAVLCDAVATCGAIMAALTREDALARWNRRDDTVDLGDLGSVRSVTDAEAAAMMGIKPEELRARLEEALAQHPEGSKILDEVRAERAKRGSGLQ